MHDCDVSSTRQLRDCCRELQSTSSNRNQIKDVNLMIPLSKMDSPVIVTKDYEMRNVMGVGFLRTTLGHGRKTLAISKTRHFKKAAKVDT